MARQFARTMHWLVRLMSCLGGRYDIIDIGAGSSARSVFMLSGHARRLVLIDVVPVSSKSLVADSVVADAAFLPLRPGVFDLALLWNVVMFVSDDEAVIGDVSRALKHGGLVALSTYRVVSGKRNYGVRAVRELLCRNFLPLSIINETKQVKALCALEKSEVVLRLAASDLREFIARLGLGNSFYSSPNDAYLVIRFRDYGCSRRLFASAGYRVNLASFSILYEYTDRLEKFKDLVSALYSYFSSRAAPSGRDVVNMLTKVSGSKVYATKLAGDLYRLGFLDDGECLLYRTSRCFRPVVSKAKRVALVPLCLGISEEDAVGSSTIFTTVYLGNPVLRQLLEKLYIYSDISVGESRDIIVDAMLRFFSGCGIKPSKSVELAKLRESIDFFYRRVLMPLEKLGVIAISSGRRVRLSPSVSAHLRYASSHGILGTLPERANPRVIERRR